MVRHAAGFPCEFGVPGTGERCRTLVSDTVVSQASLLFLQSQGIGKTQVGVPNHAKHGGHAPVRHGFGHDIGDRRRVRRLGSETDIDTVVADLGWIELLTRVLVSTRGQTGFRVKVPSVPRAAQPTLSVGTDFNGAFAERPALMRAAIVHRGKLAIDVGQCHGMGADCHGLDATGGKLVTIRNPVPVQLFSFHVHGMCPSVSRPGGRVPSALARLPRGTGSEAVTGVTGPRRRSR